MSVHQTIERIAPRAIFDPTLDRREAILARLLQIGQGLDGIASAYRNHGPTETGDPPVVPRPAYLLYDGDAKCTQDVSIHKSAKMPPTIWEMDPQIVVLLQNRDTVANDTLEMAPAPVGTEISNWVAMLNSIITNDDEIIDLVTAGGMHWLSSIATDLKPGRTIGGGGAILSMFYVFRYPLFPSRY
jgi:hypothetical protein